MSQPPNASPDPSDLQDEICRLREEVAALRESLREKEGQLREHAAQSDSLDRIFRSTPMGMCITDEAGYFERVNSAYCEFYGFHEAELIGHHFTMIVPEENRKMLATLHDAFIAGEEEIRGEWQVQKRDGTRCTILGDACLIHGSDGRPRKVTFVMDISDRKRAEKLRKDIERITTHDLKNPLTAVLNIPDVLLMQDNLDATQRDLIETIQNSGRQMLGMINRSLDLYKMEEGRYRLRPETFDVLPVIRDILTGMSTLSTGRGIGFELRINDGKAGKDDAFELWAEKLLIYSMLSNLLRNAFEASSPGEQVSINLSETRGNWQLTVRNRQPVPASVREHFFEQFTTHGKSGGTGLGTYSARLIAETHGGTIALHSSPDEGTQITVSLPKQAR